MPPTGVGTAVVTSYLPLTTTFSYQSGCSFLFRGAPPTLGGNIEALPVNFYGFLDNYRDFPAPYSSFRCVPSEVNGLMSAWISPKTMVMVSLGPVVCPEAFSTIYTSIITPSSTQVVCCPSHYTFGGYMSEDGSTVAAQCSSFLSAGAVITYAIEDMSSNHFLKTQTMPDSNHLVYAMAIDGVDFSSVIPSISDSTMPGYITGASPSKGPSTSGSLPSPSNNIGSTAINPTLITDYASQTPPFSTSYLSSPPTLAPSKGMIVGIVVGTVLSTIIMTVVAWFMICHRRRALSRKPIQDRESKKSSILVWSPSWLG